MAFIDELRNKSDMHGIVKKEVVNEIINEFREYFDSGKFEAYLKRWIDATAIKKREAVLLVNFWNYSSGCSDTCFRCGGKEWKNPEGKGWDSQNYKGVCLLDIHREVCQALFAILCSKVESMGFTIKNIENDETWLKYYSRVIRITW